MYELTAPTEDPLTRTSAVVYPESGVIVKTWFAPCATVTEPEGDIVPPADADASDGIGNLAKCCAYRVICGDVTERIGTNGSLRDSIDQDV